MRTKKFQSLYQINTRVWLTALGENLGRPATLDDVPDSELDRLASLGFDWIWFLSVWRTGEAAREISKTNEGWLKEFRETLPDLREEDIGGSGFAIVDYSVNPGLGGDQSMIRLRKRLQARGLKLMLDFVPNHMAPDHPWVQQHPDFFVSGTSLDLEANPQNYTTVNVGGEKKILAYGRDPYFAGWPDTLQLDYSNPALQEAMVQELLRIGALCDGIRCDMAMLVLPEIFERTWGRRADPFWPRATAAVKQQFPAFTFMAEVYWDLEWTLQQQGFDYTYDKRLYDRLEHREARPVYQHLQASPDYQVHMARFLENHDEPRAAAVFELPVHQAAAVITFFSQGLRFFHQGQFEGYLKRISPHLIRGPKEPVNPDLLAFYQSLLAALRSPLFTDGDWQLLDPLPAWTGNNSHLDLIAYAWSHNDMRLGMVVINYAPHASQCYLRLPFAELENRNLICRDLMSPVAYTRAGNNLLHEGMYFDLPAWGFHVFELALLPQ